VVTPSLLSSSLVTKRPEIRFKHLRQQGPTFCLYSLCELDYTLSNAVRPDDSATGEKSYSKQRLSATSETRQIADMYNIQIHMTRSQVVTRELLKSTSRSWQLPPFLFARIYCTRTSMLRLPATIETDALSTYSCDALSQFVMEVDVPK
jgi:hypothetical protein